MGSEYIILSVVGVVVTFVFSVSIILNLVLLIGTVGLVLFLRSILKENVTLQETLSELDSQLIVSDSINDIIEHVLALRDELADVMSLDLYTGDPVIQGLMARIESTLEKIETSVINQEYMKSIQDKDGT